MACDLTSSYTLDCKDSVGGVKEIYFIEFANVTGYTSGTGNEISAITKASTKVFRKYQQIRETASFTETINDNIVNGTNYVTQELSIFLPKKQTALRDEIALLGQNRLVAVVVDNNGKAFIMGKSNGVDRNGGTANSGTAFADRNGYELKFIAMEPLQAHIYTGTLSALTTA